MSCGTVKWIASLALVLSQALAVSCFELADLDRRDADGGGDTDTDSDSDTDVVGDTFFDPATSLLWLVPDDEAGWHVSKTEATAFCAGQGGDWRLPTISEMRSLVRGCVATEVGGSCPVTDDCYAYPDCWSEICQGCAASEGPGGDGCYWDPGLGPNCGYWFWSATSLNGTNASTNGWAIVFSSATFGYSAYNSNGDDTGRGALCVSNAE